MKSALTSKARRALAWIFPVIAIGVAAATAPRWWKPLNGWIRASVTQRQVENPAAHDHAHDDSHDGPAGHAGHSDETALELSEQALRNLGLTGDGLGEVRLSDFTESFTVPAVVTEQPGRTRVQISTPMNGIVTAIYAVRGEAVAPGALLFDIRLTHEDLVVAQTDFIRSLGELDIERQEIARLRDAAQDGGIARKQLLERQYERDKLASLLVVQREALRLHGLTEAHVREIEENRRLLRQMKLYVPDPGETAAPEFRLSTRLHTAAQRTPDSSFQPASRTVSSAARSRGQEREAVQEASEPSGSIQPAPLILRDLLVHRGEAVQAGQALGTIVNYGELYIEGQAFEQDVPALQRAHQNDWTVTALFDHPDGTTTRRPDLDIAYLDSEIDEDSRTLHFYVELPNTVIHRSQPSEGPAFVSWKYRPGQRLQLSVPVKQWHQQIVLPVDAVAREGAEYFVFQQNGNHFDRVPVHVKYRDQYSVVIANDGQLFPGDIVARRGAHQLQMALKNKSGGGVDPHAGHTH